MATILVVDDEEPIREFVAALVQAAGHQALQAVHGQEALEILQEERPDLVIADAMLPILGGVELCRRLKANPDTAAIPVILMSSVVTPPTAQAGADAFILKPFELQKIGELLGRLLAIG